MEPRKVVAIVSGGLDSTTLLYKYHRDPEFEVVQALSFNYGQRHKKELDYAETTCEFLHVPWTLIDLWASGLTELLSKGGSSLVSSTDVPEGHYAQDNMKSTVVPNRNMIMLSIAGGVAVALGAQNIAIGVHAGDHFVYPDCRPLFLSLASAAIFEGNKDFGDLAGIPVLAPFGNSSKADIAFEAIKLGVQFDQTWSCYKGGTYHCGRCGTCVERLEAINEAQERYVRESGGATAPLDLTTYEDIVYWRQAVTVQ